MDNWQAWGIGVAVTVGVAAFLRLAKKQKWAKKCKAGGIKAGKMLSVLIMRWLPATAAEKAEEGIVVTALEMISQFLAGLETGLLADNKKRIEKGAKQ